MTREIPLGVNGSSGMVALVDDSDYEMLMSFGKTWSYHKHKGYAFSHINGKKLSMHRALVNPSSGLEVDHINGNQLDNRRCNLRACNHSENAKNVGGNRKKAIAYKGVFETSRSRRNPYFSQIKNDGQLHYLGRFPTPEAAAAAYNEAAKRLHGEFARLNVIPQTT